jgi:hypothetical protein
VKTYDPSESPAPDQWLALSELERIDLVEDFHRLAGDYGESLRLHSSVHAVIENQLALGQPIEASEALSRLRHDGIARHDAIHAIGSVLAEHLFPILKAPDNPPDFNQQAYVRGLGKLTSVSWRRRR